MERIKKFIESNYYIAFVFLTTVICWYLRNQVIAFSIYLVLFGLILLTNAKRVNLVTIVLASIINYRIDNMESNLVVFLVFSAIALLLVLYDLIKSKLNYKNDIFIAILIVLGSNIISLVNTNKDTIGLGLAGVFQVIAYGLIFFYFFNKKEEGDFRKICINATFMGLAIALELGIHLLMYSGDGITKADVDLGWGLSNFIAMGITVIIPPTFYLYIENQKRKYILLVIIIDLLVIFITFSKGAFLALGIIFIPFIIVAYIYSKDKKAIIKDGLILLGLALIGFAIMTQIDFIWNGFLTYFKKMGERGWFNNKSRMILYEVGFNTFKKYPILGAGPYTGQYYMDHNSNYHNYVIQTLATLGIVGMITFIYYVFTIVKKCFTKNYFNICILFVVIAMSIHGLVDTTWYNPIIMVIVSCYFPFLFERRRVEYINLDETAKI